MLDDVNNGFDLFRKAISYEEEEEDEDEIETKTDTQRTDSLKENNDDDNKRRFLKENQQNKHDEQQEQEPEQEEENEQNVIDNPLSMILGQNDASVYTRTVSHAPYQSPSYMFEVRWAKAPFNCVVLDRWVDGKKQARVDIAMLHTMFTWLSHETWLWLVTQSGTLRFAPEKQVHRSKLLSLRQNIICHGDLAMPTDDSIGIRRSPAVFGGEVRDTLALNDHPFASSFMCLCRLSPRCYIFALSLLHLCFIFALYLLDVVYCILILFHSSHNLNSCFCVHSSIGRLYKKCQKMSRQIC